MGIEQEVSKAIVFEHGLAYGDDVAAGRAADQELPAAVEAESLLEALPDSILVQHVLPLLSAPDKKALRWVDHCFCQQSRLSAAWSWHWLQCMSGSM